MIPQKNNITIPTWTVLQMYQLKDVTLRKIDSIMTVISLHSKEKMKSLKEIIPLHMSGPTTVFLEIRVLYTTANLKIK